MSQKDTRTVFCDNFGKRWSILIILSTFVTEMLSELGLSFFNDLFIQWLSNAVQAAVVNGE